MPADRARPPARLRGWLILDDLIRPRARPIRALRSSLSSWRDDRAVRADPGTPAEEAPRQRCVIVDRTFPDPTLDAGSDRILRVATLIADLGWEVVVLSLNGRKAARIAPGQDIGVVEPEEDIGPQRFASHIAAADLVILSRPQVAARLASAVRRLTRGLAVYDTVDLHFVRMQREADSTGQWRPRLRAVLYRALEPRLTEAMDCTIVVSPDERAELLAHRPSADVVVIPTVHPRRDDDPPGPAERRHLVFVGAFRHGPNVDAVAFLLDEVMPLVATVDPALRLKVVGRGLPASLHERLGDDYLGWVEDLDSVLDASLAMVAPLRFGAGVKGKVGRSLAAGLPVVTTTIGAEGLGLEDGADAIIRDDPRGLADACLAVAGDHDLWRRLSRSGRAAVDRQFSPEAVGAAVADLVARAERLR